MLKLLLRIGLIRIRPNGTIRWPIKFAPKWIWQHPKELIAYMRFCKPFYVFRNKPGVIKWEPGRLLPRRWGFGVFGLIEIGDRG